MPTDAAQRTPPAPPLISVVMAVHNGEDYLDDAVQSILLQSERNFEFIIVDDGSTDSTGELLQNYADLDRRIRVIRQPSQGLPKSLNAGVAAARGQYVARMDADDIALPHRFATQLDYLSSRPNLVAVGGCYEAIDAKGRLLIRLVPPEQDEAIQKLLLAGHGAICHPSVVIRTDVLRQIGGYDPTFTAAQDLDLFLRLGEVGALGNVQQTVLKFRLHDRSVSESRGQEQRRLAKLACERAWQRRGIISARFEAERPWRPGTDRKSRHQFALQYGWWAFKSARFTTASVYAAKAIRFNPFRPGGWQLLGNSVLAKLGLRDHGLSPEIPVAPRVASST